MGAYFTECFPTVRVRNLLKLRIIGIFVTHIMGVYEKTQFETIFLEIVTK